MEPAIVLVVVTTTSYAVARRTGVADPLTLALRLGVAAMFLLTGTVHFVMMREQLVAMVPAWAGDPELAVTATGVLELAGAVGLLHRGLAPWAAAGLTTLLLAMFPANVQLALSGGDLPWHDRLLPRTALQVLFLSATGGILARTLLRGATRGRPVRSARRAA